MGWLKASLQCKGSKMGLEMVVVVVLLQKGKLEQVKRMVCQKKQGLLMGKKLNIYKISKEVAREKRSKIARRAMKTRRRKNKPMREVSKYK